ncbi:hypothetical protein ACFWDK_17890, partial [Micromonospora chalcea]
PDARGLVSGDADDWRPGVDAGVPDGSGGAPAGGDGLGGVDGPQLPAVSPVTPDVGVESPVATTPAGVGMPMMPGAPGAPGAGTPAGNAPDAPDASGLIEADPGDWSPSAPDTAAPDAPSGTGAGGAGLEKPVRATPDVPPPLAGDSSTDGVVVPEGTLPGRTETMPVAVGTLPPMPGPAGGHAPAGTSPAGRPGAPGPVRPGGPDRIPAGPEGCSPDADADVVVGEPRDTDGAEPPGASVAEVVAPPTVVEVADVETVVLPGALGPAGAAVVAGLAGRGPQPGGPDDPARAGALRRRSARDGDREPGADSTVELREDDAVWGGDGDTRHRPADDHVPLVRPDEDPDDKAGWDDLSDADWLTGAPADQGPER